MCHMTKEKSNFFCVSVHISACHVCVFLLWSTRLFTDVCFLQSLLSFLGSFHLLQYQFIGWVQSICCF